MNKTNEIMEQDFLQILNRVNFRQLQGRRVLVTGGSGLLGTYVVGTLQAANQYDHAGIDLHVHVQRKLDWIELLSTTTLHYANLANLRDCERLPEADVVISAASYAQPLRFMSEPLMALRSSSYGLMALLEKCAVGGRFFYISSSEVYCDCLKNPPYYEDDIGVISPYHPRACYIEAKRFGEAMVYLYRNRGISTVAVRPGITYGPGFKWGDQRSWAQFVQRGLQHGRIELMDSGTVRRTLCYITDGITMLFKVLLYGRQPVYNMAGNTTLSIAELANRIGEATGAKVIIPESNEGGVAGTPQDLQLAMDRYYDEFDVPNYLPIHEGIRRMVEWAKAEYA